MNVIVFILEDITLAEGYGQVRKFCKVLLPDETRNSVTLMHGVQIKGMIDIFL